MRRREFITLLGGVAGRYLLTYDMLNMPVYVTVLAIVFGFAMPASAEDRPNDPFGNYTIELNKDALLFSTWEYLKDQVVLDKARFQSCIEFSNASCPEVAALMKIVDEARQYQGKALLGHVNRSINLMIKPTPFYGFLVGPLEAIRTRSGDCKTYAVAKYAAVRVAGIPPDHVRLVVVHDRRYGWDHMVAAVYQDGEWLILDNLTNVLVKDSEKIDYEPTTIFDYKGVRRYSSAFWLN